MITLFYAKGIFSNTTNFQGHAMQFGNYRQGPATAFVGVILSLLCSFSPAASAAESLYDNLQLTDLKGNSVDFNQHKGGLVLINFWATWCPPCVKEMPSLQRLQQQFDPDEFSVVLVNLGQTATTVNHFFEEQTFGFSLPVYLDSKGQAFTQLGIQGMPSSFLVDASGNRIETIVGAREWDHPDNVKAVRELISAPPEY